MPAPLLTASGQIMCIHGGQVTLIPSETTVLVGGAPVMCVPDLQTCPIVGCPQVGPGIVPCTMIMVTEPAIMPSTSVMVAGKPAYVVQAIGAPGGLTNGNPPGMIMCVNPGQTEVMG
jgi:PAAR motif